MSDAKNKIKIFESQQIRTEWDADAEKWWFSALDVVATLTDQPDYTKTRNYWKWLKNKLKQEGSEVVSITNQLKLEAPDGKRRLTDVLDTQQVFRIIQSIPSRKAEPFKLWLAEVANQRLNPQEQASLRARFEKVEKEEMGPGVHEHYHELIAKLEIIVLGHTHEETHHHH